jgi:hypothetical protein
MGGDVICASEGDLEEGTMFMFQIPIVYYKEAKMDGSDKSVVEKNSYV